MVRSVCEDRFGPIRNAIPPPLAYPSKGFGPAFAEGLIQVSHRREGREGREGR